MTSDASQLPPEWIAVLHEEQELLARARESIARAAAAASRPRPPSELRDLDALRALRDEAMRASEDDLPGLLHEMSVRQRLLERPAVQALPDTDEPYVAHLRVREGAVRKDYLLGRVNHLDGSSGVRIVDWRVAPVAQIFYRYREGDEYEETFPGRVAEGVVEARRVVVIDKGELTRVIGDELALERDAQGRWRSSEHDAVAMRAGGAGHAARPGILGVGAGLAGRARDADVTALLDADQYEAISVPADQPLLVLGTAGSGKTTVALHRLARIATADPAGYPLASTAVVVPEEGLARLSRRLLAPLGVGAAQVHTAERWAVELASAVFGELPRLCTDAPALVVGLKRHPALHDALQQRFARLKASNARLAVLRRRLAELLTDRAFLGEVVEASRGGLPRSAVEETVRHTMLQLADPVDKQLRSIVVPEMKRALDGRAIEDGTPEELAGTMDIEDLPILLFLRAWRAGIEVPPYAHVVLDEAEDLSLFELFVMGKLLGERPSFTLAGDEAQQTTSSFAGWERSLGQLGARDVATCRLGLSYRCPQPVVDVARRLLGSLAPEGPARARGQGAPVGVFHFPHEEQAYLFVARALADLLDREPRASVAVVARGAEAASEFYELVRELPRSRLVLEGDFSFEPGLDVTDVDDVKGLEFDYVVVPDVSAAAYPETDDARRRLHVAVTRTSHQLWIVSSGERSPLVGEEASHPQTVPSW